MSYRVHGRIRGNISGNIKDAKDEICYCSHPHL
jgi:hypothetical protein